MVDYRIGDLPAATTPLTGAEQLEAVQSGVSRKVSLGVIETWMVRAGGQIDTVLAAALAGVMVPGDAAGGDLAGTYPNPTLAPLVPSPAATYTIAGCTVQVDNKGRVLAITTVPLPTQAAVLYTAQVLNGSQKSLARTNINAQTADANLNALVGEVWAVQAAYIWDGVGSGFFTPATAFGISLLAIPNQAALAASLADKTVRISSADSPPGFPYNFDPSTGVRKIMVDLSTGSVVINLPPIDIPTGPPPPAAMPSDSELFIKIHGATSGNTVTVDGTTVGQIDGVNTYVLSVANESVTLWAWKYGPGPTYVWSIM